MLVWALTCQVERVRTVLALEDLPSSRTGGQREDIWTGARYGPVGQAGTAGISGEGSPPIPRAVQTSAPHTSLKGMGPAVSWEHSEAVSGRGLRKDLGTRCQNCQGTHSSSSLLQKTSARLTRSSCGPGHTAAWEPQATRCVAAGSPWFRGQRGVR